MENDDSYAKAFKIGVICSTTDWQFKMDAGAQELKCFIA